MATYYVDLSLGTNSHTGTSGDPFSFTDFEGTSVSEGDVFKLKGTHTDVIKTFNKITSGVNWSIQAWDPASYGPWILFLHKFYVGNDTASPITLGEISGGIISVQSYNEPPPTLGFIKLYFADVHNMHMSYNGAVYLPYGCVCKGCNFLVGSVETTSVSGSSITIQDSIITGIGFYDSTENLASIILIRCAVSFADPGVTPTNCTFSWSGNVTGFNGQTRAVLRMNLSYDLFVLTFPIPTPPAPGTSPYTGYNTGLWGGTRTNIGAFDFLKVFYINLSDLSTGHNGTENDPFSCQDWNGMYDFAPDAVFNLKGSASGFYPVPALNKAYNFTVKAWDLNLYGPWRCSFQNNTANGFEVTSADWTTYPPAPTISGLLADGIIQITEGVNTYLNINIVNCFINHQSTGYFYIDTNSVFKGCTIIINQDFGYESYNNANAIRLIDSILALSGAIVDDQADLTTFTSTNSVLSIADPGITSTNSQFSWTPPTWPAWDASQSAFLSTTLSAGINTPPEPGTPPYTGYSVGLWGSARSGIGAMDFLVSVLSSFNVSSAGDGTAVVSTINSSGLISSIQTAFPGDTYFNDPSKLGKVYAFYTHESGRERKIINHDDVNHAGVVLWSPTAQDGTWQKTKIIAYDKEGASIVLNRSDIGTGEDITHSGGAIHLNT